MYVLAAIINQHSLKTTLRYLNVTNKDLMNILSPLEDIVAFPDIVPFILTFNSYWILKTGN